MGTSQARLKRVQHSQGCKAGRQEAAGSVTKLSAQRTGPQLCFAPSLHRALVMEGYISTLFPSFAFQDSAWHGGWNSFRPWVSAWAPMWKVAGLLQDVLRCAPSCPPYHSCRQPEPHSSCLSHCPGSQAAFPPAWPRGQPLSIPSCCLSLYSSRTLQIYFYCLYGMAVTSQRKFSIRKLFPFLFSILLIKI